MLLSLGLLLNIVLGTALLSLARVVETLVVCLTSLVTGETSDGTTNSALDTVADARSIVVELALSLLLLTLEVLFTTLLLQILYSCYQLTERLLRRERNLSVSLPRSRRDHQQSP